MFYVKEKQCSGCGVCADSCPDKAISMVDGIAVIDGNRCTDCGRCADICPMGAIFSDNTGKTAAPPEYSQEFNGANFYPGGGRGRGMGGGRGQGPGAGKGRGQGRGRRDGRGRGGGRKR